MSKTAVLKFVLPALLLTTSALAAGTAVVKVGTNVEKYKVVGATDNFTVPANTRLYAWIRINAEVGTVAIVWSRDGKDASKTELKVPRALYRTHTTRTFRAGDTGPWTVKVVGPDGTEFGSTSFQVQVQ